MYSKGLVLASAIRQVRGLGDNKFEVVTSLRTFIFRAEREGTTSTSFTLFQCFSVIYQLLVLLSLLVSRPLSLRPSDSLSGLVFLSPLFLLLPPSLFVSFLVSLGLTSLSLNASLVIFCLTSLSLSSHAVFSLPFYFFFLLIPALKKNTCSVIGGFYITQKLSQDTHM